MHRSIALALLCAALCLSARADAQPTGNKQKAKALYDKGNIQYNLGRWKEAIDLFTQAYEAYDNPDLLFNIGQAYRQDGNCSRAIFFYKRYLSLKPTAPNRGEVEGFIAKLQPGCVEEEEPKDPPKDPVVTPKVEPKRVAEVEPPEDEVEIEEETEGQTEETSVHPRILSVRAAGGASYLSAGELEPGLLFAISGGIAYPLHVGDIGIEPGALITFTPVPWEKSEPDRSGTVGLTGVLANGGATYPLGSGVALRGDLGIGALILSGVTKEGNPFLEEGDTATGPLTRFHLRLAFGVEYAVAPGFILTGQPVFSYSPAGELRSDISSISRFEVLIGAGYRM